MVYDTMNVTGIIDLWAYDNNVTGGLFSLLFIGAAFFISFIYFKTNKTNIYKTSDCLLASLFITFIFSSLLWAATLIDGTKVMAVLVLTFLAAIYSWIED